MRLVTDETVIVLVDGCAETGISRLAQFERIRQIELGRGLEIVVMPPSPREIDLDIRLLPMRDHNQSAPRSPRKSFKKSSKR